MTFCRMQTDEGLCWVEAEDSEHAYHILRDHYGKSVTIKPYFKWNEEKQEEEHFCMDKVNDAYLTDSGWKYSDGKPYLGDKASFMMAFRATYEEALADLAGDKDAGGFWKRKEEERKKAIEKEKEEHKKKYGW